eukprot:TRINITY_DN7609_c0_g1_i2.p1 TRINITY_DN7609_c0_g1~~TRINITY_DN7609_c0_g1_i2.p1  ORF type:complete len:224 (+),score=36.98 TRINITY_DN7609_c0_g1_i2:141-812(+)
MRSNEMHPLSEDDDYDASYKVILAGDPGVGKSSTFQQFSKGIVPASLQPTIGVDFSAKVITLPGGARVKAHLWDTAGQEKYRGLAATHYRKAKGAFLIYDITRRGTFDYLAKWIDDIRNNADDDVVIILVGNKVDKAISNPSCREVEQQTAQEFARKHGLQFQEICALERDSVFSLFERILGRIHQKEKRHPVSPSSLGENLTLSKPITSYRQKESDSCCKTC